MKFDLSGLNYSPALAGRVGPRADVAGRRAFLLLRRRVEEETSASC